MTEIIGIIPARGGSKGIPGKNIKLFAGKPLLAWTIESALECKDLKRVIVSTDDQKIAVIAQDFGAEVPFIRPRHLATDTADSVSVVEHAVQWLINEEKKEPEYVTLLQPTSPLRSSSDIQEALALIKKTMAPAVVSVTEVSEHPYLVKTVNKDGIMKSFIENIPCITRRQDLPKVYILNGALYVNDWEVLKKARMFSPEGTIAYIMPKERSLDIDTPWDFHLAEKIMLEKIHQHQ